MPPEKVLELVSGKSRWIERKLERFAAGAAPRQPAVFTEGVHCYYQGKTYPLHITVNPRVRQARVSLAGEVLAVTLPSGSPNGVAPAIQQWYGQEALAAIRISVESYRARLTVLPTKVIVKEQRKRWGSCSTGEVLRFNWRLILAPPAVLDYVVAHELAHLRVRNHSLEFWQEVERLLPAWRAPRKWLADHGWLLFAD